MGILLKSHKIKSLDNILDVVNRLDGTTEILCSVFPKTVTLSTKQSIEFLQYYREIIRNRPNPADRIERWEYYVWEKNVYEHDPERLGRVPDHELMKRILKSRLNPSELHLWKK